MEKRVKIIHLIIIMLAFLFLATDIAEAITVIGKAITGETVTGEAVTGEATKLLNMNITVLAVPTLSIISPENITYSTSTILLNYSAKNAESVWYNLDNAENITITSPLYFSAVEGSHILYLYANNSQGTSFKSVIFSIEIETPPSVAGGGGGGGIASGESDFKITPELIQVVLKKGESFRSSFKIKNTGTSAKEFKIESDFLKDSIFISESEFYLNPQEEKEVILIFSPLDSLKEDTYTGKIKISSGGKEREINVIFSLKSKIVLFDLTLTIPPNYKDVRPGGDVLFQVSIFNLGESGKADVEITYYIRDFEGNTIVEQKGIVGVETQASFSRTITLPEDIAEGQYIVGANARYDSSIGTTSDIFYVSRLEMGLIRKFIPIVIISFIVLIVLIVLLILLMTIHFRRKIKVLSKNYEGELDKIERRIRGGGLKLAEAIKMEEKLKSQLILLGKAYEKNYITKSSYEIGKAKIKKAYDSLKEKYL